ncbi:MAG: CPBP family intramembrane metalloprotease domain-containing protein [Flavobacterium sp. BFFFF1]|uniref:CPBP family intramembrane glutamic endopeptidase n=1 Tax=Flavobacterium sp. BFFFF1 TaxID=2015557 RepID=UPI000BDA4060|nr:CPBP family intramembrane glutamic endopeptidase [Flavobacterium sp. BFFFF1]OYU80994.1 MAG: CPBP family intramembrane metalloprotease domain-containing protein [Flavobacterium sp. BFFFF1]
MFIEQVYKNRANLVSYLPFPLGLFGLMSLNYFVSANADMDVAHLIKEEILKKGKSAFFIENLIPFAILLALLFMWVKFIHRQSIRSLTTARKEIDWHRVFFSFCVWGGISALLVLFSYLSSPENFIFNFRLIPFLELSLICLILVPLQTSFEEYFFRGYLMQGIGVATKRKWVALLCTSVVFGMMHLANPEVEKMGLFLMVYYIGTGALLGIMTLMDDGLELSIGFHAANNIVGALLVTSDWTVFQTDSVLIDISKPSVSFDVILPVVIIFPILLFIFSKKYHWSGWKEKLTGKVAIPSPDPNQISSK